MTDDAQGTRTISTVSTACRIIDALKDLGTPGVTDIAAEVSVSKGTIHTHLATLREEGYVRKQAGEYRLVYRFVTVGEHVRNRTPIYMAARTQVDDFAETTGEYAHLIVEDDGREVSLYESRGENAVATHYHVRQRETPLSLHDSSAGKAILAYLDDDRVESIIDRHGLEGHTENTITDRETLFETLAEIRERGFAYNNEEEMRGMRAVGAPVRNADDEVLGAISVTAPTSRLKGDTFRHEVPELVTRAANVVELNIETAETPR